LTIACFRPKISVLHRFSILFWQIFRNELSFVSICDRATSLFVENVTFSFVARYPGITCDFGLSRSTNFDCPFSGCCFRALAADERVRAAEFPSALATAFSKERRTPPSSVGMPTTCLEWPRTIPSFKSLLAHFQPPATHRERTMLTAANSIQSSRCIHQSFRRIFRSLPLG